MRTHLIVVLLVAVFAFVGTRAEAQTNDQQLITFIDGPADYGTVQRTKIWFHGWAFHCIYGQQPQSLSVDYLADDGAWIVLPLRGATSPNIYATWRGYRLDVHQAFTPYCPSLTPYSGFGFTFAVSPPAGLRTFRFRWEDRTGTKTEFRTLNLLP